MLYIYICIYIPFYTIFIFVYILCIFIVYYLFVPTNAHILKYDHFRHKNLYVKLPTQNIINIIKFLLYKTNNETITIKQTLDLIKVIPNQNYFLSNGKYSKPTKGLAMVSPVSSILAEIYLHSF